MLNMLDLLYILSGESLSFIFFLDARVWVFLMYREMTRKRIQIKKIDNISSRQVTFSKRRKGLFKKAQELSTLCDADIALIVFSATSKLFEYASSSMHQVIERRDRHSASHRLDRPAIDQLQLESDSNDMLRQKVEDKNRELRQMNGEDLQGLTLQELQKLEELLKRGLTNISKVKDEKIMQEISTLKRKEVELTEENQKLKQVPSLTHVQRQSSESIISTSSYLPEDGGGDTCLKLGLPLLK
ncbi:MADS-box protein AGL24-like [Abrus precatorius]|uniref:MADS-box protein AGL24-like n=1 Tax=Abrus precatorius TaxID=3816 RepID=A0A8B8KXQ8_ABRPR|nr:MADS-box protein AGL24-like [Abrus precatorius]